MSDIVARLLNGDSCVALTSKTLLDGKSQTFRTELGSFVLRSTHFWGLSPTILRPVPGQEALAPQCFAHSDCFVDFEPTTMAALASHDGAEQAFELSRGAQFNPAHFVTTDDYEPVWSSAAGDDPAIVGEIVAQARDIKVALCLGGDLWLVQRCVLPQYMREKRYFRLSTPEGRIPFFMTWERHQLEDYLEAPGARASIQTTTFQAGVVIFSSGKFIWFNAPTSGVEREYQELRLYASRRHPQTNFAGA